MSDARQYQTFLFLVIACPFAQFLSAARYELSQQQRHAH